MDPYTTPITGTGSITPPPPPPPKSKKCMRIVLLAVAAIAAGAGITAAVIYFAVPAIGLSVAVAATAMAVGSIGLLVLGIAAAVACKQSKKKKSHVHVTPPNTMNTPSKNTEISRKEEGEKTNRSFELVTFGSKAFVAPQAGTLPDATPTHHEWNKVITCYQEQFKVVNDKAGKKTVGELMRTVYFQGTFYASQTQRYNDEKVDAMKAMGVIVKALASDDPKTANRRSDVAKEMVDAFLSCQDEQIRVISRVSNALNGGGLINKEIESWWHDFKLRKLNELIYKHHPGCEDATDIQKQFAHIQSAYLVLLGKDFGLQGGEQAEKDEHKPTINKPKATLAAEYRASLDLVEFAKEIAADINSSGDAIRLEKEELIKWLIKTFPITAKDGTEEQFGFYSDERDYTDLVTLTDEHRNFEKPCITLNEVVTILKKSGIGA